jgi:hypothetical protein
MHPLKRLSQSTGFLIEHDPISRLPRAICEGCIAIHNPVVRALLMPPSVGTASRLPMDLRTSNLPDSYTGIRPRKLAERVLK